MFSNVVILDSETPTIPYIEGIDYCHNYTMFFLVVSSVLAVFLLARCFYLYNAENFLTKYFRMLFLFFKSIKKDKAD